MQFARGQERVAVGSGAGKAVAGSVEGVAAEEAAFVGAFGVFAGHAAVLELEQHVAHRRVSRIPEREIAFVAGADVCTHISTPRLPVIIHAGTIPGADGTLRCGREAVKGKVWDAWRIN